MDRRILKAGLATALLTTYLCGCAGLSSAQVQIPSVAGPVGADPDSADRVTPEPVTADPVTADPVTADPVTADPVTEFVMGNVEYILLHEIAHLLIRDLDVPVIGPEEGAADYIATAVLIRAELFDRQRAARARQFLLATANGLATAWEYSAQSGDEVRYWDSHALTIQRFYQIICLVYGSDQHTFETLPASVGMPAARASRCSDEFARAGRSLAWLLDNYGRQPADPAPVSVELTFGRPPTRTSRQLIDAIRESGMLENTVRRLQESFTVPTPFGIDFRTCREPQAAWIPEEREIVFCYELLDSYYLLGRSRAARERDLILPGRTTR